MTLAVAAKGNTSIWLLTDRRLTAVWRSGRSKTLRENATKTLHLETPDGVALFGYAGLGETAGGTEPGEWMSRVLRGRNLALEPSMGAISNAIKAQMPSHLRGVPAHHVVIAALCNGEARLYGINLVEIGSSHRIEYTRYVSERGPHLPRVLIAGSSAQRLGADKTFARHVIRLVDRYEAKRSSAEDVAAGLARLSYEVAQRDRFVGPKSIVAWRAHKVGGGQRFFHGTVAEDGPSVPSIAVGLDIGALGNEFQRAFERSVKGAPDDGPTNPDQMRVQFENMMSDVFANLAKLPAGPDPSLK